LSFCCSISPRRLIELSNVTHMASRTLAENSPITHEEVVREFRDVCLAKSTTCRRVYERKFFYLFTCEYCFSHYVTALFLIITRYKLVFPDWRGYLIAGFSIVWVANVYMRLFGRIRLDLKRERVQLKKEESDAKDGL
jgi:hypothetical protein